MVRILVICLGKRITHIEVPWITPENWDEIVEKVNKEEEESEGKEKFGYKGTWKKVGNEYRIYIEKVSA